MASKNPIGRLAPLPDNVGTITFVPGVRFVYPVLENWWLKPFGQFGLGKDFSGSDIAYIYGVGIKSLATFELKSSELDFGTAFTWADQSQSGGGSDSGFSMIDIGFNSRWPTNITVLGRKSDLNLYFVYTEFVNNLNFERPEKKNEQINRFLNSILIIYYTQHVANSQHIAKNFP